MQYGKSKKIVAGLWIVSFLAMLIQLFVKVVNNTLTSDALTWYFQFTVPTITLILSVLISDSRGNITGKTYMVNTLLFLTTIFLSVTLYVCMYYILVVARVVTPDRPTAELIKDTDYFMITLQGLINLVMGFFFFTKEESAAE